MNKPEERRRYKRMSLEERAIVRSYLEEESDRTGFHCKIIDVSVGGMQIRLKHSYPVGEKLDIMAYMEGYGNSFHLVGEVKWIKALGGKEGYAIGIEIQNTLDQETTDWKRVFN
ncbi:MAG TPA: PilZ domain-containing protein [Gammaproteobacteria bacterium]|nr:PilZ domain-containing protein [Gammaproteobacteria bacterium]